MSPRQQSQMNFLFDFFSLSDFNLTWIRILLIIIFIFFAMGIFTMYHCVVEVCNLTYFYLQGFTIQPLHWALEKTLDFDPLNSVGIVRLWILLKLEQMHLFKIAMSLWGHGYSIMV